jgi:hypothetical protein
MIARLVMMAVCGLLVWAGLCGAEKEARTTRLLFIQGPWVASAVLPVRMVQTT